MIRGLIVFLSFHHIHYTQHRLVFYYCFVLALVGFVWTSVLVRDRPHPSLEAACVEKSRPGGRESSAATVEA